MRYVIATGLLVIFFVAYIGADAQTMKVEKSLPSHTATVKKLKNEIERLQFAKFAKSVEGLTDDVDKLVKLHAEQTTKIADLNQQIADLKTMQDINIANSQAVADIVSANAVNILSWIGEAEDVLVHLNTQIKFLDERLKKEEEYRNNIEPPSDWLMARQLAIAREQHALLKLQHFDIMQLFTRRTGKTIEIRSRRESSGDGLPDAIPNAFPPPIVNKP